MNRILKISRNSLLVCFLVLPALSAQETKTVKNIKVILVDDEGKKTVIDTLINDGTMSDTIKLRDGKVIVIDDNTTGSVQSKGGTENISVTVNSDEDDSRKIIREVRVVSSDSINWKDSGKSENIYVFNSSSPHGKDVVSHQNMMTWSEKDGKESGKKVIIINDGNAIHTEEQDIIRRIDSEESKQDFEKTKYMIKRDGMVISVEGEDYNKVKEIVEEIESTLDRKNNITKKDPVAPADPKKDSKKK